MTSTRPSGTIPFPPTVLTLWRLGAVLGNGLLAAAVTAGCSGAFFSWHLSRTMLTAIDVVIVGMALFEFAWLAPARYRCCGWQAADAVIDVYHGAIFRRRRSYPADAVLFMEKRSGPVLRHLGLVSVHLHDLSGTHEFGHLTPAQYREITQFLTANRHR